eukprot:EG_transcript_61124
MGLVLGKSAPLGALNESMVIVFPGTCQGLVWPARPIRRQSPGGGMGGTTAMGMRCQVTMGAGQSLQYWSVCLPKAEALIGVEVCPFTHVSSLPPMAWLRIWPGNTQHT